MSKLTYQEKKAQIKQTLNLKQRNNFDNYTLMYLERMTVTRSAYAAPLSSVTGIDIQELEELYDLYIAQ